MFRFLINVGFRDSINEVIEILITHLWISIESIHPQVIAKRIYCNHTMARDFLGASNVLNCTFPCATGGSSGAAGYGETKTGADG